ncbi:S1/P1 nuclease [Pseudidiomarina sp. PP-1MA]|uniref:S1/P1 nuclease n=1 Tax=Pseudidiomarina sp. PP-1MA TaxID=3237706 RepID=A0AB39X8A6_9GAMM
MQSVYYQLKHLSAALILSLSLGFVSLVSSPAHSYGGIGHDAFCQLAFDLSSPKTQQVLQSFADQHPDYEDFASMCNWADNIKSDKRWDWAKPHHYVNFARGSAKVTAADCAANGCILSAIQHHYDVLKHDRTDWIALAFLAHFIGDLHQPMHVSFADDLGGNRARLSYFDEATNLHRLWDTQMLMQRGGSDSKAKASELLRGLSPLKPAAIDAEQTLAWANESAAITRRIYSDYRAEQKLGQSYTDQWGPVLEQRMQQGAQRLAAVLDELYGDSF